MRRFALVLAALPLAALAQYGAPQPGGYPGQYPGQAPVQQPAPLYPYNKNQLPPGAVYDNNPGIPTSGLEQGRQLDANKPGYQKGGPTIYHRSYDRKGSTAVISGPNGTTVCRDEYGRKSVTGVCY